MKLTKIFTLLTLVIGFAISSCSVDERVESYQRYDCQIGGQWYTCAR